jgi:tRNA threonylcarbamoyladenosine biosynthesis protein TsaE
MTTFIPNPEAWPAFAQALLPQLQHNILLLKGEVGAGKTTFSQALLAQMGCTDEVNSPTYAIVNEYDTPNGKVFHFDLYRIKTIAELDDLGFEDYLTQGAYCIVEWPEIYEPYWPEIAHHVIEIKNLDQGRALSFE